MTPKAVTGANGALTEAGTNGTLTEESGVSGNDGGSAERGENEPRNKGQGGLSDGVAPAGTSSVTQLLPPNLFAASPTRIFERRAMHFERGAAAEVHADVLGLSRGKLHHTISTLPREAAEQHVTLSKAGPPQPCREDGAACVRRAKRTKATLIVNGAELLDAGVHELVSSWRRELGVFVSAGFYSTPKGKQGFLYHSDKTDVLVLQLEGSKRWEVCGRELPKLHLPPSYGEVTHFSVADSEQRRRLLAACGPVELAQGDTLYLPVGVVHRALATLGDASLHLTVAVPRTHHFFAWGGLLISMLAQVRAVEAVRPNSNEARGSVATDEVFQGWLNDIVASEEEMALLPRCFSTPERWNVVAAHDGPSVKKLAKALRTEFATQLAPRLREWAQRDAAAKGLTDAASRLLQGRVDELDTKVLRATGVAQHVVKHVRARMRTSMVPPPTPNTSEALEFMRGVVRPG